MPFPKYLSLFIVLGFLPGAATAQQKGKGGGSRFSELEARAVAEPFVGVTTNGIVEKDLFEIESTGVSTEPVRNAAEAFLAGLTDEQRSKSPRPHLFRMDR